MTSFSARDTLISRLVKRDPARTEADIQSDIHALLVVGELMNIGDQQARMESPSADGTRRRIDVEVGQLAIEVKKDLRNQTVRVDGEAQLEGYIKTRTEQSGAHYSGVLTDGVLWLLFNVGAEGRRLVAELDMTGKKTHVLVRWLEAVLSTQTQVKPTPAEIVRRLGASSPAHLVDVAAFRDLYQANANNSEVALKRELWAKLLRTAFGSAFEDDETLFINHTLLVLTAEIIAHAALGFDVSATGGIGAKKLSLGTEFSNSQIVGVVQPDFFDWPLDVDGGEELIANVARRISQFNWEHVEHDVLKLLYESVIDTRDRKALGEYYTPDWLAQSIVDANVDEPLTQRVADVACGSGTFLFHAIRRYLAAADRAAMSNGDAISGLTSHVTGMDVHPVAVTIARVTYLLAIGAERLKADDRGPIAVPVYLGDSLQWEQQADIFTSEEQLTIATSGADLVGAGAALFHENLVFPKSVLHDAANFDRLVTAMSDKASDTSNRKSKTVISPTLRQFGIPEHDMDVLVNTYDTMRRLHADGRDGIWGYYVRNLVRPTWLSADDNKVDVLVGNPPWLRYGAMTGPMQKRFTSMLKARSVVRCTDHSAIPSGGRQVRDDCSSRRSYSPTSRRVPVGALGEHNSRPARAVRPRVGPTGGGDRIPQSRSRHHRQPQYDVQGDDHRGRDLVDERDKIQRHLGRNTSASYKERDHGRGHKRKRRSSHLLCLPEKVSSGSSTRPTNAYVRREGKVESAWSWRWARPSRFAEDEPG